MIKLPEELKKTIISGKIYLYLLIVLLIGVWMMVQGNFKDTEKTNSDCYIQEEKSESETVSNNNEETKLKQILSKVDGVGKVDIIINYTSTSKKIPLFENKNKENEHAVTFSKGNETEPYIVTEKTPEIEGVVIVAQGVENGSITQNLRNAVSGYLGIPVHKISILKMK